MNVSLMNVSSDLYDEDNIDNDHEQCDAMRIRITITSNVMRCDKNEDNDTIMMMKKNNSTII